MSGERPARALGLLSGGLDSTLAARRLLQQGVEVTGIHFATGFCMVDHRRAMGRPADRERPSRIRNDALRAAADLGIPVEIVDIGEEFLREVVLRPKHGYGSAMNPCLDCRIFMLRKAGEIANERGFDLVFTGEVVGQRPMSQTRKSLEIVERESGLTGRLLRPLCARHLPPTEAETEGLVDRSLLGTMHGRSRREQLRMAEEVGLREFPTPGGGCCFLADRNFARRLRDRIDHGSAGDLDADTVVMLKVGRHFRLGYDVKAVFGRDEMESRFLQRFSGRGLWTCQVADGKGSLGLAEGELSEERARQVAGLAARYSRSRTETRVEVRLVRCGEERFLTVEPASEGDLRKWLI